jgi:hypothetical protein
VEDLGAGLATFEALVDFFADMDGEAGDFAVARVHGNCGVLRFVQCLYH